MSVKPLFGEFLIKKDLVSREELEAGLRQQKVKKKRIGEILHELGLLSDRDFLAALSEYLEVPAITLKELPEKPLFLENLSVNFLKQYRIFPIRLEEEGQCLHLAMVDPLDLYTIDDLQLTLGYQLKIFLISEKDLNAAIERLLQEHTSAMDQIIEDMADEELEIYTTEDLEDEDHLRDMASEAPIIKLVNLVMTRAVERGASDIHIEPFENQLRIRYRIDGVLHDVEPPPKKMQAAIISRIKIMAQLNIAERRLPQDGRIRMRVEGKKLDLRVSSVPTLHGESVVMRILDQSSSVKTLDQLGFPEDTLGKFERLIRKPHGIILVTGPTGSGKTTTLYAVLDKLNEADVKIITIEDPVEYQMQGVNQIQVRAQIGLTFANGLRSIVRQDPDIILVGEIRDRETAEIAIQSSLTGHLVLSTLHTNDAPGAITRLVDMGVENFLVSSTLEGALAQRLVRVICDKCKAEDRPAEKLLEQLQASEGYALTFPVYKGEGCEECGRTGYRGRKGIYEMLLVNDDVRRMILENASATELRQEGKRHGMRTLRDDAFEKVRNGITTIEEMLRVTQEEESPVELADA